MNGRDSLARCLAVGCACLAQVVRKSPARVTQPTGMLATGQGNRYDQRFADARAAAAGTATLSVFGRYVVGQ